MCMKEIDITFKGQDYSSVESAKVTAVSSDDMEWIENLKKKDSGWEHKLLCAFLDDVNDRKIIINSPHKIYDPYFNGGYFCGMVGVLKKRKVEFDTTRCFTETEIEELQLGEKIKCNITLQIQSRMDKDKPFFLSTLLLSNKIQFNSDMVPSNEEEIFDYLLLFWFKSKLQSAYLKGFYRTYRRFEQNDDKLKGSIDIARHIKLNLGQHNGKIAYAYRENTVNNYLNHLIVAAYDYLKKKYYQIVSDNFDNNIEMKSIIDSLRIEIGGTRYSNSELIAKNLSEISHPYYTEYEDLRKICIRILREEGISLFDGDMEETEGILFYLPDLWEDYLQGQIERKIEKDIRVEAQKEIKVFGYINDKREWKYAQPTRPDYVFFNKNEKPYMIMDAKFKPGWGKTIDTKKLEKYLLGDYDKALRDMVSINGCATGVIFPILEKEVDINNFSHSISEYNKVNRFYTIPVQVPNSQNMDFFSWTKKFDKYISQSMDYIRDVLNIECQYYDEYCKYVEELEEKRAELEKG